MFIWGLQRHLPIQRLCDPITLRKKVNCAWISYMYGSFLEQGGMCAAEIAAWEIPVNKSMHSHDKFIEL